MTALEHGSRPASHRLRIAGWGAAGMLLLLPAVAMQLTDEVNWDAADFVFAGILVIGVGVAFELALRLSRNLAYRAGAAVALGNMFLITWANAAVGIIGSERNPTNWIFTGIVLLALVAAASMRFRARGMGLVMAAAACAQLVAAGIGLTQDVRGAVLSVFFVALWLTSALLFNAAARSRD
jgi:hypothetical protein